MKPAARALSKLLLSVLVAAPCLAARPPQVPGQAPAAGAQDALVSPLHLLVDYDELRALRNFFERVDVAEIVNGMRRPDVGAGTGVAGVLARLSGDWEAPFAFVRDAVRHAPYTGSVRGAEGVAEARAGNALDQALLLRALLEARGVETRLMRGRLGWSDAARLIVGSVSPAAPQPDDPWPRWLEAAADHWWVQARRDDRWVDLDPSFPGTAAGERVADDGVAYAEVPEDLQTRVQVTLYHGSSAIAATELDSAALVGETVGLSFSALSATAVANWEQSERALQTAAGALGVFARALGLVPWQPRGVAADSAEPVTEARPLPPPPRIPPDRRPASDFQRLFLDPGAGPWMAHLVVGGRALEAGPLEAADLESLHLSVVVRAPQVPLQSLDLPWEGGSRGRLAVVVGAGDVSTARLAQAVLPLYRSLNDLAVAERSARDAMRPPIAYFDAAWGLRDGAAEAWDAFDRQAPPALGWAVLYGSQSVAESGRAARTLRQGLRLAAVRWRPPGPTGEGSFAVVLNDPVIVGQLSGAASARGLRAAYGLLQSAVLSQALNRLADRAPETAFDATLRAIGTGRRMTPLSAAGSLPTGWPAAARADAARALGASYALLAPLQWTPADGAIGWWQVGVADGEMTGWVVAGGAPVQGQVELGAAGEGAALDVALGRIPALHHAARWLADLGGSGSSSLASLARAACGSASVAADALREGLPPGWPTPDVLSLCTPG